MTRDARLLNQLGFVHVYGSIFRQFCDRELHEYGTSLLRKEPPYRSMLFVPIVCAKVVRYVRARPPWFATGTVGRRRPQLDFETPASGHIYDCLGCLSSLSDVDCGTDQRYTIPAKSAGESTVQLLLDNREEESLTVYTDRFRAYDPLEDDEQF